jgi:hypothetical protein
MIEVSVFYPNGPTATLDITYDCEWHLPMVRSLLGSALKDGHLYFDSVESFQWVFGVHYA